MTTLGVRRARGICIHVGYGRLRNPVRTACGFGQVFVGIGPVEGGPVEGYPWWLTRGERWMIIAE
jgi:hypothetical protein